MLKEVLAHTKLKNMDMVWLVDANGRVAKDAIHNRIGSVHDGLLDVPSASVVNNNVARGVSFGKGLTGHGMWLPATFPAFSLSSDPLQQGTFKAGGEKKGVRIDYVAVSDTVEAQRSSARV